MSKKQPKEWNEYNKDHPCAVCVVAKHKEAPHLPRDTEFADVPLQRLHTDILSLPTVADDRLQYSVVVVDEAFNYPYVKPCEQE